MKRFCVECGKEIIKGTYCKECQPVEFEYHEVSGAYCMVCRKLLFRNKWSLPASLDDGLMRMAVSSVKAKARALEFEGPTPEALTKVGKELEFTVPVAVEDAEADIPVKLLITTCPKCSKLGTKYFEAILQIRPLSHEVLNFALNELEKQKDKGIYMNKKEETAHGINLYLTNQTYAKVLARKIADQFGGNVSKNEKLFSRNRQTSKDVFRLSILVQLPLFTTNDVIVFEGAHYQISSMKKTLSVINLETGQKTSLPFTDTYTNKYQIVPSVIAHVTRMQPSLEVLHPETFQSVGVRNESLFLKRRAKPLNDGEKIRVAFDDSGGGWALLN